MLGIGRFVGAPSSVLLLLSAVSCSTQSEEAVGDLQQAEILALRAVDVRRSFSETSYLQYRALDSQNALPSGALAEPALLSGLVTLGGGQLDDPFNVDALLAIPGGEGATLLKYVARCALGEGEYLRDLPGRLGLAPGWQDRALSVREQKWVTACLMAHTNNLAHVEIAVSGTISSLSSAPISLPRQIFPVEEAAFYGNVFTQGSPRMYACSGIGTQHLCSDRGVGADLARRICGSATGGCGFKYMGPCNELSGSSARSAACSTSMPYRDCLTSTGTRMKEVVTTNLLTDVALLGLQPSCGQKAEPTCPASHDVCSLGQPLGTSCSEQVCLRDPYCCQTAWDSSCIEAARTAGKCP